MDSGPPSTASPRPVSDVRRWLREVTDPVDGVDRVPISVAAGRVPPEPVPAATPVPGADVAVGDAVAPADRRLGPADLALAKAAGVDEVPVRRRPTLGIAPVGDDLVQREPDPDERVETTGFACSQVADRWGFAPTYRDVVSDEASALRAALQRDLTKDALVLTGVTGEGTARDVLADLGTVAVEAVALAPGGTLAAGVVHERPVLLAPPDPVGCLVAAVQFLNPLLGALDAGGPVPAPTETATLGAPLAGEPDATTAVPVRVEDDTARPVERSHEGGDASAVDGSTTGGDDPPTSDAPTANRSITLADAAQADGWVVLNPSVDALDAGETVAVENWRYP